MMNNIMEHPHMKSERETEVGESYLSSLRDLTVNSKPLINMLTILAEENLEHAAIIVGAVERHIAQVPREVKLPILYLIDSIVKNVRHDYIQLFTERICSIFCNAFRKVDEKIREKMFALRNTWNDVFTQAVLYRLDVEVHGIDPGWPIIASMEPITPLIHVNPIFFNRKQEPNVCDELEAKKRELLELKKRKLELELAATKKQLEKQMAQDSTPQSVTASLPIMQPSVTEVHGAPGPMVVPVVLQPKAAINNRPRFNPVAPGLIGAVIRPGDPRLLTRPNSVANNQNVQPMVIDSMNLNATANHQLNNISYMDMQNMDANQMNNMKMEPIKNNRQLTEKDNNSSNRSTSRRGRDEYSSRSSSRSSRSSRTSAESHRSSTTKSRSSHYDKKGSRSPTRSSSSERKKRGSSSSKSTRRSRSRSRDNSGSDKSPQKNSNSRRQESSPTSNCGNNLSSPNGRTRDAKPLRTYANRNKINSTSVSNEIENELNISPLRKEQSKTSTIKVIQFHSKRFKIDLCSINWIYF